MKILLALALSCAATNPDALSSLTAAVLAKGKPKPITDSMAKMLGFPGAVPTKAVALKGPDGSSHGFYVVYDPQDPKRAPVALIWARATLLLKDGARAVSAIDLRTTVSGKLEGAVWSTGAPGQIDKKPLDIGTKEVQEAYAQEKKIILEKAPALLK